MRKKKEKNCSTIFSTKLRSSRIDNREIKKLENQVLFFIIQNLNQLIRRRIVRIVDQKKKKFQKFKKKIFKSRA